MHVRRPGPVRPPRPIMSTGPGSRCGSHHLDQSCGLGGSDWPRDPFPSSLCHPRIPMLNIGRPIVRAGGEEIACEHSPGEFRIDDVEA